MSVSTIIASQRATIIKGLTTSLLALLLVACGANEVMVEGNFPKPLLEPLPLTIGVYYDPAFRTHEFHDKSTSRSESDWIVRTGAAQMEMYDTLLTAMFDKVVLLNDIPREDRVDAVGEERVDAVLVPHVDELQYSIPRHTKVNVFEIWMKYRFEVYSPEGELLTDWTMTSYGKTPTAFLQGAEAAVNLAAVVALRDAGANFAMNFPRVPEVKQLLDARETAALDAAGETIQ